MNRGSFTERARSTAQRPSAPSERRRKSIATEVAEILDEIRAVVDRSPEGARAAALRLVSLLGPGAAAEPADCRGGLASWQQSKVDRYLREHLERRLQVKQLAQHVSLSVSHFGRAFKDSFGSTPHTHIVRLRLERAMQLMLATQDPLSDIALRCGLSDQAHLSKLFRRWMGETPNAWRRRNAGDPHGDLRGRCSMEAPTVSPRLAA